MTNQPTVVERAFQLAAEGRCRTVADIRQALKAERYDAVDSHLGGGSIKRQLTAALAKRS